MPFKTRTRKISAAGRRFNYLGNLKVTYKPSVAVAAEEKHVKVNVQDSIENNYLFVKKDLLTIFALATLVVVFQVLLLLVLNKS